MAQGEGPLHSESARQEGAGARSCSPGLCLKDTDFFLKEHIRDAVHGELGGEGTWSGTRSVNVGSWSSGRSPILSVWST